MTLWSLYSGLNYARLGRIRAHKATFFSLYWYGLMIAGLVNFLPDRRINKAMFGGNDSLGWGVIGISAVALILFAVRSRNTVSTVVA